MPICIHCLVMLDKAGSCPTLLVNYILIIVFNWTNWSAAFASQPPLSYQPPEEPISSKN